MLFDQFYPKVLGGFAAIAGQPFKVLGARRDMPDFVVKYANQDSRSVYIPS